MTVLKGQKEKKTNCFKAGTAEVIRNDIIHYCHGSHRDKSPLTILPPFLRCSRFNALEGRLDYDYNIWDPRVVYQEEGRCDLLFSPTNKTKMGRKSFLNRKIRCYEGGRQESLAARSWLSFVQKTNQCTIFNFS